MMSQRSWLAVVVAVSAAGGAAPVAGQESGAPFTAMAFNIRYGSAADGDNRWQLRRELVLDVIRARAPDVLGVQEALHFQLEQLRRSLPAYQVIGVGRDGGRDGEYSALLVRAERFAVEASGTSWLSPTPDVVGSRVGTRRCRASGPGRGCAIVRATAGCWW